jgi:outer membrane biosynthesis protein TonB
MQTSTSRKMGVLPALALVALLGAPIAGCGDSGDAPSDPSIPTALAGRLAELSDEAAEELSVGDPCAAEETVDELEQQVEQTQTEVPPELRGELEAGVQKLAAKIECVPLPPVAEQPQPEPAPIEQPEQKPKKEEPKAEKPQEEKPKAEKPEEKPKPEENGTDHGPGGDEGSGGTQPDTTTGGEK